MLIDSQLGHSNYTHKVCNLSNLYILFANVYSCQVSHSIVMAPASPAKYTHVNSCRISDSVVLAPSFSNCVNSFLRMSNQLLFCSGAWLL